MSMNQESATAISRPLGALEKLFWLADQNRPTHFAIAAEVDGSTRIEQWHDALDRVCKRSALIWSRMRPGLRDPLGRVCGQRLKLAIGAPEKTLCDRVRQNALAVSDLADIVSETSQIIRQVRAERAHSISSRAPRRNGERLLA